MFPKILERYWTSNSSKCAMFIYGGTIVWLKNFGKKINRIIKEVMGAELQTNLITMFLGQVKYQIRRDMNILGWHVKNRKTDQWKWKILVIKNYEV